MFSLDLMTSFLPPPPTPTPPPSRKKNGMKNRRLKLKRL